MLGEGRGHAAGLGQEQPADAVEVDAEGVEGLGEAVEAEAVGQQVMEGDVEGEEAVEVGSGDRGLLVAEVAGEFLAGRGGEAAGGLGGDLGLDRPARGHPLEHVVDADGRDVGAALRLDQHEALEGEAVQGGRHRQPRDAEAPAERGLVDRRAGQQLAAGDLALERAVDALGLREPRLAPAAAGGGRQGRVRHARLSVGRRGSRNLRGGRDGVA